MMNCYIHNTKEEEHIPLLFLLANFGKIYIIIVINGISALL